MVAPRSGDLQIARCEADVVESVLLQHALRRDVVDERRSFQAMESELSESELHDRCDCAGREPAAATFVVDPVADARALERAAREVGERDRFAERLLSVQRDAWPRRNVKTATLCKAAGPNGASSRAHNRPQQTGWSRL